MMLDEILHKDELTREEIIFLLNLTERNDIESLYKRADQLRSMYCGDEVHLSGVIDISNNCVQNCIYCGLREDNFAINRYRMTPEEIIETAKIITNTGIYNIILQSGEDPFYDTDLVAYIIYSIKQKSNAAITLSLGERGFDEYRTWKIAGADRYLLKFETANSKLYSAYHIKQKLSDRIAHLRFLKNIGYQTGSGNMIGMPMQTYDDIADDILLCKELELEVAAFGPFIPSPNTPYRSKISAEVDMTLKTMAVARLALKSVHIPSTTALATLDEDGRLKGLSVGANFVMPDLTPLPYRSYYQVYANRKCMDENPLNCHSCLQMQIESIGRKISTSRNDSIKMYPQTETN